MFLQRSYIYIHMYVCSTCMYVCMYVRMYVCVQENFSKGGRAGIFDLYPVFLYLFV